MRTERRVGSGDGKKERDQSIGEARQLRAQEALTYLGMTLRRKLRNRSAYSLGSTAEMPCCNGRGGISQTSQTTTSAIDSPDPP